MPWETFEANVIHYTDLHRKAEKEVKRAAENLLIQLLKAQLGELTRNKQEQQEKKKEGAARQAALMVAPPQEQPMTQEQVPMQPMTQNPYQVQQSQNQATQGGYPQPQFRNGGQFRGRPMNRNGAPRKCWNCGEMTHMMRNCPYPANTQGAGFQMQPQQAQAGWGKQHNRQGQMGWSGQPESYGPANPPPQQGQMGWSGQQASYGSVNQPLQQGPTGWNGQTAPQGPANWSGQWMSPQPQQQVQAPMPPGGGPM
ncbi:MAG: hypothetical protein ACRC0X_05380, partial [Brevinema sp.]